MWDKLSIQEIVVYAIIFFGFLGMEMLPKLLNKLKKRRELGSKM